jgi:hypothetical protein
LLPGLVAAFWGHGTVAQDPQANPTFTPPTTLRRFAQHDPSRKVFFTITLEEKGNAGEETGWSMKGEGRYALLPSWDGSRGVDPGSGLSAEQKRKLGLEVAATSEDLFELRGGFVQLKKGEVLQFYLKESKDQGKGWLPPPEKTHTWVGSTRDGATTRTLDGKYTSTDKEDLADSADASLVRTETGARLRFRWWMDPGWEELGVSASICGFSRPEAARVLTFDLTEEDLRNWDHIVKTNQGTIRHEEDAGVSGTMTATLSTARIPEDEIEVAVEPGTDYESWIPKGNIDNPKEPGKDLQVDISVHKKGDPGKPRKARLSISIPYVSKNRGVCGNWPREAGEEEGLRFREADFPKQDGLLYKDRTHLESDVLLEKARFRVHSYDYGAWGTLRVTAKDEDGKDLKVKVRGKDSPDLDIPLDEDANRIADAWEPATAKGKPQDWDAERTQGQDALGDGMTLYNEYRGVVVLENGSRTYKPLSPSRKEMYVLDPERIFPCALWADRTSIDALTLDETMVDPAGNADGGPLVNFNASDAKAHGVFAIRVQMIKGDTDPDPPTDDKGKKWPSNTTDPSFPLMAYCMSNGTLKSADYLRVFPDRARLMVRHYIEWLALGLRDPSSGPGQDLPDPKNLFSLEEAQQALNQLETPAGQEAVVRKLLNVFCIHELGHACGGLPDHGKAAPKDHLAEAKACFMWNPSIYDQRRMIVLSALGRGDSNFAYSYGNFCRDLPVGGFRCFRSLTVKDW